MSSPCQNIECAAAHLAHALVYIETARLQIVASPTYPARTEYKAREAERLARDVQTSLRGLAITLESQEERQG